MSEINTELLKKTLAHIETHPDEWEQDQWVCGTSACFAGHAVALSGIELPFDDDDLAPWKLPLNLVREMGLGAGEWTNVNRVAAHLIGIKPYPARWADAVDTHERHLFAPTNNLDDLRRIVAELCGETATAS